MSENRSLAVLEVLVHLSSFLPDNYILGAPEIPGDVPVQKVDVDHLPEHWRTLNPRAQLDTRRIGDEWAEQRKSAVVAVPSVILGELNYVLNPAHLDFGRISFAEPVPFRFDIRLIPLTDSGRHTTHRESSQQ